MDEQLQKGLLKAGVGRASTHLFLCIGPDCCASAEGEALWEFVKTHVRQSGLEVMRTKAGCFRICTGGPWLVVYPEGVWYGQVTPQRFERIFEQHIGRGQPVEEWVVARNPNCGSS